MDETDSGDALLDELLELVARDAAASASLGGSPGVFSALYASEDSLVALQAEETRAPGVISSGKEEEKKKKYQRKSDPNRVRNARNAEIRELKREIDDLSALLNSLQTKSKTKRQLSAESNSSRAVESLAQSREGLVWEEICRDQQLQRVRAEKENLRLRDAVGGYSKRTLSLHRSAVRSAEGLRNANDLYSRLINRVHELPIDLDADTSLYNELVEEVAVLHDEADMMLQLNGLAEPSSEPCSGANIHDWGTRRSLDIFLRNFLPFDLDSTDDVIWHFYSGTGKHRGPLYFKSTKKLGSSNDMVLEKYALELFANYTPADFRYRQVMRRYKEGDRVKIVWVGIVEPLELANKSFTRLRFQSKGYMVCEPMNFSSTPQYTHFRRCQRFTPYLTGAPNDNELEEAKQDFGAIMDFMLSLDSANVHFQQFQDELLRQSMDKQRSKQS